MAKARGALDGLKRDSFTAFCGNDVVACAGFVEMWPGRATVWADLDGRITPNIFLSLHRHVARAIKSYQPKLFHRLEMTVLHDFKNGRRWAKSLGFNMRCKLPMYDQWKRDYLFYERIR